MQQNAHKFWKCDISIVSEKVSGFFCRFFWLLNSLQHKHMLACTHVVHISTDFSDESSLACKFRNQWPGVLGPVVVWSNTRLENKWQHDRFLEGPQFELWSFTFVYQICDSVFGREFGRDIDRFRPTWDTNQKRVKGDMLTARPYESCKNIRGPAPPICPFGAGTSLLQNISAWSYWSGGNQRLDHVEE